jgi:hypothetical protein
MSGFSHASTGVLLQIARYKLHGSHSMQTMHGMVRRPPALVPSRHQAGQGQAQGLPDSTGALPVARGRACTLPTAA